MQLLKALTFLPLLFSLVLASPLQEDGELTKLYKRGQSSSCGAGSTSSVAHPRPAGLPMVEIDITHQVYSTRNLPSRPWTDDTRIPDHRFRWRAAGARGHNPIVEIQLYGYIGAYVELLITAPRTPEAPEIYVTPNENINGGGAAGWGETTCLSALINYNRRRDITFVLRVGMGNMNN